jgi:DNA-binding LytR/AlgR family response regulator
MKYNCLIVDDEPLACEIIESFIEKFDDFKVVAKVHNAVEAFQLIKNKPIDLLFLDIQMPRITGLEFLKTLQTHPQVIITTAYREFAVESFELDVLDYLIKPIAFERFMLAINKFYRVASKNQSEIDTQVESNVQNYFYVKENKRMVKIEYPKILYIESIKDYVKIHTDNFSVVTKMPISSLEEKLPTNEFLRVHRSYIINLAKIGSYTSFSIIIQGKEIPIGRSYKNSIISVLGQNEI